jgi:hypothetical protein
VLIKTVNTKRLFFNELSIYRKDDNERANKDFIIKASKKINKLMFSVRSSKNIKISTFEKASKKLFFQL